jgi:hypothetical protein
LKQQHRLYRDAQNDYWEARSRRARRILAARKAAKKALFILIPVVLLGAVAVSVSGKAGSIIHRVGGLFAAPSVAHTVTARPVASETSAPTTPAPSPTESTPAPAQPAMTDASAVVMQFYADITDQDYSQAWQLGGDNIGGLPYDSWVAAYSTTASVTVGTIAGFGPGQVQATIIATQDDGSVNTYQGTYTVENGQIVAANIQQTS